MSEVTKDQADKMIEAEKEAEKEADRIRVQKEQAQKTPGRLDNLEGQRQSALVSEQVQQDINAKKDSDAYTPHPHERPQQPQNVPVGERSTRLEEGRSGQLPLPNLSSTGAPGGTASPVTGGIVESLIPAAMIYALTTHMSKGNTLFENLKRELQKQGDYIEHLHTTIDSLNERNAELERLAGNMRQAMRNDK